jgi:isoleucyl-tRNA synthetase
VVQKEEMRDLGVMADWDNPNRTYRTMGKTKLQVRLRPDHDFVIRQLRLFKTMVDLGYITHRLKPTYYSPTARTALAEAELRYTDDHESRSIYVALGVEPHDMSAVLHEVAEGESVELAIWTTTPWSLPSNMVREISDISDLQGVAVRQDFTYLLVRAESGRRLIVQSDRLLPLQKNLGQLTNIAQIRGKIECTKSKSLTVRV